MAEPRPHAAASQPPFPPGGGLGHGRFFGVDFSGAADAGRRIWITEVEGRRILSCRPARELPGGGVGPAAAHAALVALIAASPDAVFGLDFPFSLPAALLATESWTAFAGGFAARFPDAATFRAECARLSRGRELRRDTDVAAKVPWAAYNLRLYRQTYHGIRDVLAPLLAGDAARIRPMQEPAEGRAIVLEICPASALKAAGLYRARSGYKAGRAGAEGRARLLDAACVRWALDLPPELRARIVADPGGDALDSLIAAAVAADVTHRGLPFLAADHTQAREGMVYV